MNVERVTVDDEIFEAKFGGEWRLNRGPLEAVSFGVSYSDRSKEQETFNNFSPTQGGDVFCAYCGYNVAADPAILSPFSFDGFLSGVSGSNQVPNQILEFSLANAFRTLNSDANINNPARQPGLTPAEFAANAADLTARRDAAGGSVFGFYTPDVNPGAGFGVDETVTSLFVNTQWSGDFGGDLPWSANIGFRDRTYGNGFEWR